MMGKCRKARLISLAVTSNYIWHEGMLKLGKMYWYHNWKASRWHINRNLPHLIWNDLIYDILQTSMQKTEKTKIQDFTYFFLDIPLEGLPELSMRFSGILPYFFFYFKFDFQFCGGRYSWYIPVFTRFTPQDFRTNFVEKIEYKGLTKPNTLSLE